MIAIAMGAAGLPTRVLAPARGALLTFGSLDAQHASAPGQVSADELRHLYRLASLNEQTLITGLIGAPIAHSVSPHMHNAAFASLGLNGVYLPLEVDQLAFFMRRMVRPATRELDWKLRGLSVTAPHKTAIIEHLDEIDSAAREIGAVNTVVVGEDGRLFGCNTDAAAAIAPLKQQADLNGARVAVLGAGGAARAVLWQLRREGARTTIFARDLPRAANTAEQFGAELAPLGDASFGDFDVVINTTPLGTRGALVDESVVTASQLRGASLVYDLVYNPPETRLLREARAAGCRVLGGLPMLIAQAAEQFRLWTNQEPPPFVMHEASARRLSAVAL
jgi:3-dehydroquinate dehydratase/shikimate dehydrogenase